MSPQPVQPCPVCMHYAPHINGRCQRANVDELTGVVLYQCPCKGVPVFTPRWKLMYGKAESL